MIEDSRKIYVLLFLFTANLLFAECGLIGDDGSIHPDAGVLDNTMMSKYNSFFQMKKCDGRKCGYAFLLHSQQDLYGCSSKEEYAKSVKKNFERDLKVKESKKFFSYAGIAKKYSKDQIRLGCDFVKLKPEYVDFSLTGYAYLNAEGLCPAYFYQEKNVLNFLFVEKKKRYEVKLKKIREIQDKSSELVYFDDFFPVYIKPCVENKCDFILSERLPNGGDKSKKATLIKNIERISVDCDILQIEPNLERNVTGVFVARGTGLCELKIKYKSGEIGEVRFNVLKENDNYNGSVSHYGC